MQGVQVKVCYPLTMHAIPERLRNASFRGAIQIDYLYLFTKLSKIKFDKFEENIFFEQTSI